LKGLEGLFSFNGVFAEDLITIIALDEYPIIITATAVIIVLSTDLSFPAIYQMAAATKIITVMFSTTDSETTQMPAKKSAETAKAAFFFVFTDE
jgi:hypothetical protein